MMHAGGKQSDKVLVKAGLWYSVLATVQNLHRHFAFRVPHPFYDSRSGHSGGQRRRSINQELATSCHLLPLDVCTLRAAADRAWPCGCLEEPAALPTLFLCAFCRLLLGTESDGEAVDRLDWRKWISVKQHIGFLPQTLYCWASFSQPSLCKGLPRGNVGEWLPPWPGHCGLTRSAAQWGKWLRPSSTPWCPAGGGGPARDWPRPCGSQSQSRKAHRRLLGKKKKKSGTVRGCGFE